MALFLPSQDIPGLVKVNGICQTDNVLLHPEQLRPARWVDCGQSWTSLQAAIALPALMKERAWTASPAVHSQTARRNRAWILMLAAVGARTASSACPLGTNASQCQSVLTASGNRDCTRI